LILELLPWLTVEACALLLLEVGARRHPIHTTLQYPSMIVDAPHVS
jgi:hypothetical protein